MWHINKGHKFFTFTVLKHRMASISCRLVNWKMQKRLWSADRMRIQVYDDDLSLKLLNVSLIVSVFSLSRYSFCSGANGKRYRVRYTGIFLKFLLFYRLWLLLLLWFVVLTFLSSPFLFVNSWRIWLSSVHWTWYWRAHSVGFFCLFLFFLRLLMKYSIFFIRIE